MDALIRPSRTPSPQQQKEAIVVNRSTMEIMEAYGRNRANRLAPKPPPHQADQDQDERDRQANDNRILSAQLRRRLDHVLFLLQAQPELWSAGLAALAVARGIRVIA